MKKCPNCGYEPIRKLKQMDRLSRILRTTGHALVNADNLVLLAKVRKRLEKDGIAYEEQLIDNAEWKEAICMSDGKQYYDQLLRELPSPYTVPVHKGPAVLFTWSHA